MSHHIEQKEKNGSSSPNRSQHPSLVFSSPNMPPVEVRQPVFLIGRAPDCDLALTESRLISGKHCELECGDNGTVFLIDHSTNGTIVNGVRRIRKGDRTALNDGDIVYLVKKRSHSNDDISFTFYEPKAPSAYETTMRYSPDVQDDDGSLTPPLQTDVQEHEEQPNNDNFVENTLALDEEEVEDLEDDDEPAAKLPRITRVADEMIEQQKQEHNKNKHQVTLASQETVRCSNELSSPPAAASGGTDAMEEMLSCSICCEIIHNAVSVSPCNHKFCAGCYSGWMERSSHCPVCRNKVEKICKDHQFNSVIDAYLQANPDKKRSEEELKELESRNKIVADNMKRPKRIRQEEEEDDAESYSDTDYSSDEDQEGGGSIFSSATLTFSCGHPQLPVHHRFGNQAARFICRQCPGQSGSGAPAAAYVCQPNQNHFMCQCCLEPVPDRRHDPSAATLPKTQCSACHKFFCHIYWGCRKNGCNGCLSKFKSLNFGDKCLATIINNNTFESNILVDYLKSKNLTWQDLLNECITKLASGQYTLEGMQLNGDSIVCYSCGLRRFQQLAYQYRRSLPKESLPAAVTNRTDCWWGKNCTTQRKAAHASRLNHICEQTRH